MIEILIEILQALQALKDSQVPFLLTAGGLALLLISLVRVRKVDSRVEEIEPRKQSTAIIVGVMLMLAGIGLYVIGTRSVEEALQAGSGRESGPSSPGTGTRSVEEALQEYYSLIRRKQYAVAWRMLSAEFIESKGLTFEEYVSSWERSGAATVIALKKLSESRDRVTLILTLDYSNSQQRYRIEYEIERDVSRGDPQFGYWLFVRSRVLESRYP